MGKMTALLEKYKLIEKEDDSSLLDHSYKNEATSKQETTQPTTKPQQELHSPSSNAIVHEELPKTNVTPMNPTRSQASSKHSAELSAITKQIETKKQPKVTAPSYDKLLSIDEVYASLQLDTIASTDSVFLLENLINALPEDLPEFVKKTTVNNIITASAMNLHKLLEDGQLRFKSLQNFSTEYAHANSEEIAALKIEISRLSAIIEDYSQQIKHKESLITEETTIIQNEQNRIQSILEIFSN